MSRPSYGFRWPGRLTDEPGGDCENPGMPRPDQRSLLQRGQNQPGAGHHRWSPSVAGPPRTPIVPTSWLCRP